MSVLRRRALLAGSASLPLVAIRTRPANAAEFTYKMANNVPATHPITVRMQEASDRIKEATGGKLEIRVFPNNQLGSDTDMLSQLRSGALEFFTLSGVILATISPATAISGVGFAFKDYDQVWKAMDGPVGESVRAEIDKRGLVAMEKMFDNGYRQITSSTRAIRTPEDLKGFKIRVPVSPMWTSIFLAFGAAPTSINFSEVYSALQTKIVEGQENPLTLIQIARLYEVQKYVSMTGHMWDAYWLLGNKRAFQAMPPDMQQIFAREMNQAALNERADLVKLNDSTAAQLKSEGLEFIDVDKDAFREVLKKAGYYAEWKKKFGDKAWGTLESVVGTLS